MNLPWPNIWRWIVTNWDELALPTAVLMVTVLAGYVVRRIVFGVLRRWSTRTSSHVPGTLIDALRGPIIIWSIILGIYLGLETARLPRRAELFLSKSLFVLWIISLTVMATHLVGNLLQFYARRNTGEAPAASLTKSLAQIGVVCVGTAIILAHFNIAVTPVLTALGVGGLAVALALQDTLGNLFGGFYTAITGQVRLGDYVKLNTGEEGYVADISWRSTTLRMLAHNLVIVPNSKLAQAIVTNYSLPEKRMGISIEVGVGYDSDPDHVERVLLDVARTAVPDVAGLLADPEPSVRFKQFADSALTFQLNVQIEEFTKQYEVQHELRKRVLLRFREEKIDIPFPIRSLYLNQ